MSFVLREKKRCKVEKCKSLQSIELWRTKDEEEEGNRSFEEKVVADNLRGIGAISGVKNVDEAERALWNLGYLDAWIRLFADTWQV